MIVSPNTGTARPQLLALTGLRFFLAFWVVVFHLTASAGPLGPSVATWPVWLTGFVRTGYAAVGIFFVLSGFVLSYNYPLDQLWSFRKIVNFGIARFARIYPAYFLGLLAIMPLSFYGAWKHWGGPSWRELSVTGVLNATLLQSWVPGAALSWNGPGWSLSNEAFFYLCFPFVGVLLWKCCRASSITLGLFICWMLALAAPVVATVLQIPGFGDVPAASLSLEAEPLWANVIKFNPLLRLFEFSAGILTARAYLAARTHRPSLMGRGQLLYLPAVLGTFVVLLESTRIPYPLLHNGLLLPLNCLLVLGVALGGGSLTRWLSRPPMVLLGNASYSLYILHSPIAAWMAFAYSIVFSRKVTGVNLSLIYLALTVTISIAVFKWLEEPANNFVKARLRARLTPDLMPTPATSAPAPLARAAARN